MLKRKPKVQSTFLLFFFVAVQNVWEREFIAIKHDNGAYGICYKAEIL